MVLGFHSRPSHVAQNIIVGLDFDGTVSCSAHLRVEYAKVKFGATISLQQTSHKKWPKQLGEDKYWEAALFADNAIERHILVPGCKEVLMRLRSKGFRFAIVTARKLPAEAYRVISKLNLKAGNVQLLEQAAVARFISAQSLPVDYLHHVTQGPNDTKDYLCGKLRARAFIDDSIKYLLPLRGTFVQPFFLRQPWNVHEQALAAGSGVKAVNNWLEFENQLLSLKQMHEAICYFNRWENAYYNVARIATFWKSHPDKCNAYLEEYKKSVVGALA